MANRQALRELQTRLAARLQQARAEGVAAGWLAVELTGRRFLLPLAQSGEIFPVTSVQKVPYTQDWFMGVANLRGGLYGIVDLASFISGTHLMRTFDGSIREQARLIALNSALEVNCAILIDRLGGLRGVADFVSRDSAPEGSPAFMSAQYVDKTGQSWIELDLQQLAGSNEFLGIATLTA
ncbi:chemotaxis protein CheW [Variovorax sp. PCZ-1]|uniref:chemotaxis protein CheW n=1 Tax=Variovorax sp. PCZ-1 TaxID=2835533 RepID=UPI001BD0AFDE|nr:chemotaxis protein CheW [Variovorax sp. PCZ-1]MBS7808056.1 chemotaxis protein CheW [Variovorax sp. PCZ-1]